MSSLYSSETRPPRSILAFSWLTILQASNQMASHSPESEPPGHARGPDSSPHTHSASAISCTRMNDSGVINDTGHSAHSTSLI